MKKYFMQLKRKLNELKRDIVIETDEIAYEKLKFQLKGKQKL